MSIILSHSGKQHAYHTAKILTKLGALSKFYTSSYIKNIKAQKYLSKKNNTFWTRRFIEGVDGSLVDANWRFEVKETILRKIQGKSPSVQNAVYERDIKFDAYVARELRKCKKPFIFWGFQGSCFDSLQVTNELEKFSICELAMAHITEAKRIFDEECQLIPAWADSINHFNFPAHYEQRLREEPHIAKRVIAASEFTKRTLVNDGIDKEKIDLLPLGFDLSHIEPKNIDHIDIVNRPLRLLFAGTVTQAKGVAYLLEAMGTFLNDEVELHFIGGIQGSGKEFKKLKQHYTYHPPVSQLEIFRMYKDYDALIHPSLFEGFGLVILEAMAAGLPVITTLNTIGPELISDNKNGYIVPIRDVQSIQQAIGSLRAKNNHEFKMMCVHARTSAMSFSWEAYEKRLEMKLKGWEKYV